MMEHERTGSIAKPIMGTDEANIDDKGRILISKKKRERLGDPFVLALGEVGCLTAYPESTWLRFLAELDQYEPSNPGRQQFNRLVMATAEDDMKFDAQGRVVVPLKYRQMARLNDKVLLVGCFDRLEIWDEQEYLRYQEQPNTYGHHRREAIKNARAEMVAR